jgi:Fur family ferric uptake transcriptional regulator
MIAAVKGRHPTPAQSKVAALRSRLRASGLRATPARLVVLSFLESAPRPVSHADLVEALADSSIDRVTLYRNLTDLTQVGLVRRADLGDHVWRFESAQSKSGHAEHPHFTCVECGEIACLSEASVRVAQGKGIPRSARRALEIQIRGVCDRCS